MIRFFNTLNIGGGVITPTPPPAQEYDYDLFIIGGQSNMDGRNQFVERPAWLQAGATIPNCKMWDSTKNQFDNWNLSTNSGASASAYLNQLWALDSVFFHRLDIDLGIKPFLIKRTQGGTAIYLNTSEKGCWNIDFDAIDLLSGTPALLRDLTDRINAAVSYLNSVGKTYKFRGFIWHQGESDADLGATAQNQYYQNFKDVIVHIRNVTSEPNLPAIYGMIPDASASFNLTIRNAQIQIASEDDNAYLADLSDLTLMDAWHFDSASSIVAGNRYADIFINNNL